jgi:hypothetical protein
MGIVVRGLGLVHMCRLVTSTTMSHFRLARTISQFISLDRLIDWIGFVLLLVCLFYYCCQYI